MYYTHIVIFDVTVEPNKVKAIKILGEDRMSSARNLLSFASRFTAAIIIINFKRTVIGELISNYFSV